MKRVLVLLLVLVILGAGGAAAWFEFLRPKGIYDSPNAVELPEAPSDASATRTYLASPDGQRITRFQSAASPLLDHADEAACKQTATALDSVGTPDELFGAAAGIPDTATSEVAVRYLTAATHFLGACLRDHKAPSSAELKFTSVVLSRRLEQVR